jgi:hypothetical protein
LRRLRRSNLGKCRLGVDDVSEASSREDARHFDWSGVAWKW